jgi:hypothetical protein
MVQQQPAAISSAWWLRLDENQPSGNQFFENTGLHISSYQKQSLNTARPKRQSPTMFGYSFLSCSALSFQGIRLVKSLQSVDL